MKQLIHRIFFITAWSIVSVITHTTHAPRLTVILVIDQLPYHIIEQLRPNLSGGLKYLLRHGINYSHAYMPHALPATATGHAALNTGTFAKDHGIIANAWYDAQGNKIAADDDFSENAHVFGSAKKQGKSAKNLMVDGISDTITMYPTPGGMNKVIALSLKSRAAIMCAGHLGKAIWFDEERGVFTSSKAFYQELPSWLTCFNASHQTPQSVTWYPMHCITSRFYDCTLCGCEAQCSSNAMFNTSIPSHTTQNGITSYKNFMKTPHGTQMLLDAAYACIEQELPCEKEDHLVVWISISSTDFIGHEYGTQSPEYIDLLYHIDCQLKKFMRQVTRLIKSSDILWVLTSDHGSAPIPETLRQEGYHKAHRIDLKNLQTTINETITKDYQITDAITIIDSPNVYLNATKLHNLESKKSTAAHDTICSKLLEVPGIKRVWRAQELKATTFEPYTLEYYFQQQLYPGRSGDIIFQVDPYCMVSKYKGGTTHESPYNYDTHVPLVIYQKGEFEQKIINETVLTLQFAPTLAHVLRVPKPSSCTFSFLPGSIPHEIFA